MVKSLLLKMIGSHGYELRRRDGRSSLIGVLTQAKKMGVNPAEVIDVGAAHGRFTETCSKVFPDAGYLLIEPLEEYTPYLDKVCSKLSRSRHIRIAAAARSGEMTFNVHPDLVGSSFYRENEDSDVNGVPRSVSTAPLDVLVKNAGAAPPYLLKVDVQGGELDVLDGAGETLKNTELLILEASFLPFFDGAPLFHDVIAYMKAKGFVVYDIFGLSHRPLDGALAQADIILVGEDSPLRADHRYATGEQRQVLTRRLRI